jgi:hypothetical protein
MAAAFPRVEGMIIGFDGDVVLIDRGADHGVFQGMELDVFREGELFKHPLTSEVLGRLDRELGMIRVHQVRERYAVAVATVRRDNAEFRQGDGVRVSMARMIMAFPNVEVEEGKGGTVRSVTRELAAALVRTGRFELIEDRQLRSLLLLDRSLSSAELADPRIFKQLAERGKAQALVLARLTSRPRGTDLDVQVLSALTGKPLLIASAAVTPASADPARSPSGPPPPGTGTQGTRDARTQPAAALLRDAAASRDAAAPAAAPPPVESFRLGQEFDRPMEAMAAGDLDGDGRAELLLASTERLWLYGIEGRRLRVLGEWVFPGRETPAVLEVADVTGDGRGDIILSLSRKNGRFHSYVLHWRDGRIVTGWDAPDVVLRSLPLDGRTGSLFGQAVGPSNRGPEPIRQIAWNGRAYVPGTAVAVPPGLSLLSVGLANLGSGEPSILLVGKEGALEVHSLSGKLISRYRDRGRTASLQRRLGGRFCVVNPRNGGQPEIIVGLEEDVGSRLWGWMSRKTEVRLAGLRWDGATLERAWQTPAATEGRLADFGVADLGDGQGRHLLLLVVREGRLGFGGNSEILARRLPSVPDPSTGGAGKR